MSDQEEEYSEEEVEEEVEEAQEEPSVAAEPAEPKADAPAPAEPAEQEEGGEEGEEEEEQDDEPKPPASPTRRPSVPESGPQAQLRKTEPIKKEAEEKEMTEAEIAMMEAKKRHEAEEEAKAKDSDERRRQELQQVEQELEELKRRQIERKAEREQEDREMAERRRQDEERRRQAEEERKARIEAEKERREEEKRKQRMMAGSFGLVGADGEGGKNFEINKSGEGGKQQQGLPGQASSKRGISKEQAEEAKRNYMAIVNRPVDVSNMLPNDIKNKIRQLHARIVKLESEKYDLEKRMQRQDYDQKELIERQKNSARQKALDTGVDPSEMENSNLPPKVRVASKFDRQTDRRDYGARRELFEHPPPEPEPAIAHGSGRPPAEWGRKEFEELEQIRKNLEPPKYVEQVKAEGEEARPPVPVIPMQVPSSEWEVPPPGKPQQNGFAAEEAASVNGDAPAAPAKPAGGSWRDKLNKEAPPAPPKKVAA